MATQQSATILVSNQTGGSASIWLFHRNSSNQAESGNWLVAAGQSTGPLTVYVAGGPDNETITDYWSIIVQVRDGPNAGLYVNGGDILTPYWKECRLGATDSARAITLLVSPAQFTIPLGAGTCTDGMTRLAPCLPANPPISHVFVVMLENHSFDNIFAMSGIDGVTAPAGNFNSFQSVDYYVQSPGADPMTTIPGHEFQDVLEQLAGETAVYNGGTYPAITNSGFVSNYATSTTESTTHPKTPPPAWAWGEVMTCFTRDQLPTLNGLGSQFALCDQWYSSIPGPTWPNRFFLHGASSSGLDHSPTKTEILDWLLDGFEYANGSIFEALEAAGIPFRLYHDTTENPFGLSLYSDNPALGSVAGAVPQSAALKGVHLLDFHSLRDFEADLQAPYPYPYTFIEPHYGDIVSGTYSGGSSQHPVDDVYGGQLLLAAVYSAIRNSPYWETSLLVITYDEHGGFYDSGTPGPATAPGDDPSPSYSTNNFTFEQYGVRVPAVVVSPLIPAEVNHTLYDHSSVLKTLETLWGLGNLTGRDAAANDLLPLLSLAQSRTDCPSELPVPPARAPRPQPTAEEQASIDAQPLPESDNVHGTLWILAKTEWELTGGGAARAAEIKAKLAAIRTRGDARAYAASVIEKLAIARAQRRLASPGPG